MATVLGIDSVGGDPSLAVAFKPLSAGSAITLTLGLRGTKICV